MPAETPSPTSPRAAIAATLGKRTYVYAWERAALWALLAYCVVAHAQDGDVAVLLAHLADYVQGWRA